MKKIFFLFITICLSVAAFSQFTISPALVHRGGDAEFLITLNHSGSWSALVKKVVLYNSNARYESVDFVALSSQLLRVKMPLPANAYTGVFHVSLHTDAEASTEYNILRIDPSAASPRIISVSPDTISYGHRSKVTVRGINTHFTNDSLTLSIGRYVDDSRHKVSSIVALSDTVLTAEVIFANNNNYSTIKYDVLVYNKADSAVIRRDAIVHNYPSNQFVTYVYPDTIVKGTSVELILKARNVDFTLSDKLSLGFDRGTDFFKADSIYVINDSTLGAKVNVPSTAYAGSHGIILTTSFEEYVPSKIRMAVTNINGKIPELLSIMPSKAKRGQATRLKLNIPGTYLTQAKEIKCWIPLTASFKLEAGQINVVNDSVVNVTMNIPADMSFNKAYPVYVSTDNDGIIEPEKWLYIISELEADPRIVSVYPASAKKGETVNVQVTFAGMLLDMAKQLVLDFNNAPGIKVNNITRLNNDELIANITIDGNALSGTYPFTTGSETDGVLSYYKGFKIDADPVDPKLLSISEKSVVEGQVIPIRLIALNTRFDEAEDINKDFDVFFFDCDTCVYPVSDLAVNSSTELSMNFKAPVNNGNTRVYTMGVYNKTNMQFLSIDDALTAFNVGVDDVSQKDIRVYPNPATNEIFVRLQNTLGNVVLIDNLGKTISVKAEHIHNKPGETHIQLIPYQLKPGLYYMKLESGRSLYYHKIFVE